jgi:hypothetical protein
MKKLIIFLMLGVFVFSIVPTGLCREAQEVVKKGQKGASDKAYEHASEQSVFNRVGDWFATIGKSKEEKQQIIQQRKAEREAKKAEKRAQKLKKQGKKGIEFEGEEGAKKKKKCKKKGKKKGVHMKPKREK